jgi:class 3 adenylate cyclase/tetratricopeptide (TPR) repeat protein
MQCPRCQHENAADGVFCDECGARLESVCSGCGESNRSGAKFCRKCGQGLSTAVPSTRLRFDSPHAYTPKHLAEKILTSKAALEGERKQVTVLFADLKGSMELLADRDPEEARKILDPVLERMMEAVHRYEGTVNQVMGDGIMALFGAPLSHEDHAVRACYAALRMQEAVGRYAEGVRRAEGLLVQIRVGLNSGEVVVRAIGSDLHMDYTAVGQTTHVAARLEQLAAPGTVLASADTLRLAEGWIEVKPLGAVNLKGLPTPVEVHEVRGVGIARTRLQAAALRGLTPFVGRDAEMDQLRRALAQSATGHGQVVAVVGEPGVGKSRLFYELTRSHRTEGWLVLESGSVSHGRATPYLPVIDLLRSYFRVEPRDGTRAIREKVAGKILTLDRALEPSVIPLLALLDVPVDDADWQGVDPLRRRQQTRDAVRGLLVRESRVQPLLVVFEDLHWIDSETQAFLDGLVESLPSARLLLLVNYRPEYRHSWGAKGYYTQLRIDALPPESAEALLSSLLGTGADVAALRPRLIAATEGNPFFLEETVRTLAEVGVLNGERGGFRLVRPLDAIQVPPTVQAVLAARIDRIPPDDKRLLQSAAVVGKDVPLGLLLAIAEVPEEALRAGLARLGAAEFLYETSLFPELEYTFKHALTHEVAYGSLLGERRRELHGRIVEAIERLHADRLAEHVDVLAHHSRRAERWDKALDYLRQAGARASGRLALQEAADYLEHAVAAADRLPRTREVLEQLIDVRVALRGPLFNLTEFDRLRDHLSRGEELAREIGDDLRLARITAGQAHYYVIVAGQIQQGLECAARSVAITETPGAHRFAANARTILGQAQHSAGSYLEAIATLRANVDLIQREQLLEPGPLGFPPSLSSRTWLTFSLAEVGRFGEAIATAEELVREAEALAILYPFYHAYWALGAAYLERGAHERAIDPLRRVERVALQADLQQMADNATGLFGHVYALAGRLAEAVPLLEAVTLQRKRRNAFTRQRDMVYLGDAYLRQGRVDDALSTAARALDLARSSGRRGREAYALKLLGDVLIGNDDPGAARDRYHEALALGTELAMHPHIAHCHLGLGKLYRRTGKRQEAHEYLSSATTMYREMDMRFYLEQAEAAMREMA